MYRFVLLALLCCLSFLVRAQDYKYEESAPIDVSQAGWNKALLLANGNTAFFHFEPRKGIIVKLFDKERKEIVSRKHICNVLDINVLDKSFLDGIVSINNEAVLFVTQQIENKETTLRLRIDGSNGALISEEKVIQSESFKDRTRTIFLKNDDADDYYFVSTAKKAGYDEVEIMLNCYDATHKAVKTIPIAFDQKGYDNISLQKAMLNDDGGILLCIEMGKIVQYPDVWERECLMAFLPKGKDRFLLKKIAWSTPWKSFSARLTHNQFANTMNLLFSGKVSGILQDGSRDFSTTNLQSLLVMDNNFGASSFVLMNNSKINSILKRELDTNQVFDGSVIDMYTNKNGLSTIMYAGVSENQKAHGSVKATGIRSNVAFTQCDDNGGEVWGAVLPKSRLRTYKKDFPSAFYSSSADEIFYSTGINTKSDFYIMFNDVAQNFDKTIATSTDSVYNGDLSNAICYHLNKKKEITKSYLFGKPEDGEYKQLYTGSADYKKTDGTYAAVFLHTKGKEVTTKLAWFHFEP